MAFRGSEVGLIIGGDLIEQEELAGNVILNRDVYMPLTASYMDTISIVYFSIVGAIGFFQFCVWMYKRLGENKEAIEEEMASQSGIKSGSRLEA